jgi:signal transduction histidine kinase
MEDSADPAVKRAAPKLVNSISRAVNLCESTLTFGKAEEPPPALDRISVARLINDAVDSERLATGDYDLSFSEDVPTGLVIRADAEQLYRVLTNLIRNARQAIIATGEPGEISVQAGETDSEWFIRVTDTGPGLPKKAQEHLFTAFQGGTRKGGTGLGLVIAAELVRGHGGRLELVRTGPEGTVFALRLPKAYAALDEAAE